MGKATYSDEQRAFALLAPRIRDYKYPPGDSELYQIGKIRDTASVRMLIAVAAIISITAFGVFYLVSPGDAFRWAAKALLTFLPIAWLGALVSIIHYGDELRCATALQSLWERWADARRTKSPISN